MNWMRRYKIIIMEIRSQLITMAIIMTETIDTDNTTASTAKSTIGTIETTTITVGMDGVSKSLAARLLLHMTPIHISKVHTMITIITDGEIIIGTG